MIAGSGIRRVTSVIECLLCCLHRLDAGCNQHGKRIAGAPGADGDLHVGQVRPVRAAPRASRRKPGQRSPSRSRTHVSSCSRRSSTSTRPPGTTMRAASEARARDRPRGAAPARAAPRRRSRRGSAASRARRASSDVGHAAGALRAPARASAPRPTDRPRSRATPSGSSRPSDSLRRSRDRRRASGGSRWPSARAHAAQLRPGTSCRSFVSGPPCSLEVLLPQAAHLFEPRVVRAPDVGRRRPIELRLEQRPERGVACQPSSWSRGLPRAWSRGHSTRRRPLAQSGST